MSLVESALTDERGVLHLAAKGRESWRALKSVVSGRAGRASWRAARSVSLLVVGALVLTIAGFPTLECMGCLALARPTSLLLLAGSQIASAQDSGDALGSEVPFVPEGLDGTPDEIRAWLHAEASQFIEARELAEARLQEEHDSYQAQFVLGFAYHYGESNAPRALFHVQRSYELFQRQWGRPPGEGAPWRWHAMMVQELIWIHSELEHYERQLAMIRVYNERFDPDMLAEQAWPLMKLRRFDDARRVATEALDGGDPRQVSIALNAFCAIEFEAGDSRAGYEACRAAMENSEQHPAFRSAVDYTNTAEGARSLFRLDEAENLDLEASRVEVAWYGNPWIELADLYTREGRFVEALDALRQAAPYRAQRPAHVRDNDRGEARRVVAQFFLVVGEIEHALRLSEQAMLAPDRKGHNSRDPAQDTALAALIDRRVRRMRADQRIIESLGAPMHEQAWAWLQATQLRFEAWQSARQAARALADDERMSGIFMIGTSRSAVMPPWLVGELSDVLGAGVTRAALARSRAQDARPEAIPYYDAFESEALLRSGDSSAARRLALAALSGLQSAERLLRARTYAVAAEAERQEGELEEALGHYDQAFQADPGVFGRLEFQVPVRYTVRGELADDVVSLLRWSPRFTEQDVGLVVEVVVSGESGRVCLYGASTSVLGCADETRDDDEDDSAFVRRLAVAFDRAAFAPRIDLSQVDASSLDGSNIVSRNPVESLFGTSSLDE